MAQGTILTNSRGRIAGNPFSSALELAIWLRHECGADGYRMEGGVLVALRWDLDGNAVVVDRFALTTL